MSLPTITSSGKIVFQKDGVPHRDEDRPAVLTRDGFVAYYKYGKLYREGGNPCRIWADGMVSYHHSDVCFYPDNQSQDKPTRGGR